MAKLNNKFVMTIGTGKKVYVDMAVNLAMSFLHWHRDSDIIFQLVTDHPQFVPSIVADKIQVIAVKEGELGKGFAAKLQLDRLISDGKTIFIDSDCLLFENISHLFEKFSDHEVSVIGDYISNGEWFGDIAAVCKKHNIPHLPKFNGGLYYIRKGIKASAVYQTARDLEGRYDQIGLVRLRGLPNDELLMAIAIQLHGQIPIVDDGSIMSDPQACPGNYFIDVINGNRRLVNPPAPDPLHRVWYPFKAVSPAIVHFLGRHTTDYQYVRECYRLKKLTSGGLNIYSEAIAFITIEVPAKLVKAFKDLFRPVYRRVAGYREIKISDRL